MSIVVIYAWFSCFVLCDITVSEFENSLLWKWKDVNTELTLYLLLSLFLILQHRNISPYFRDKKIERQAGDEHIQSQGVPRREKPRFMFMLLQHQEQNSFFVINANWSTNNNTSIIQTFYQDMLPMAWKLDWN